MTPCDVPQAACSNRVLLEQIADKWSILILGALCAEPLRFNVLKRRLDGVTQKALTQTLRKLERNGIIARRVLQASPVAVEYSITPLGQSLKEPFYAVFSWTIDHHVEVSEAQAAYDARMVEEESGHTTVDIAATQQPYQPHTVFAGLMS
jgi:DNA-binding HxlR family transcriptional regulator